MDLTTLAKMFLYFTFELLIGCIMLINKKLNFRFKPYISIPVGLIISFGSAIATMLWLHYCIPLEKWSTSINIISYTFPLIGVYLGLLFCYKINPMKLILTVTVAYTFQHMAYQCNSFIFDTGLQNFFKETLGEAWVNTYYDAFYNFGTLIVKIAVFALCYLFIARTYVRNSKYILKTKFIIALGIISYFAVNITNVYVVHHIWWDNSLHRIISSAFILFCILYDELVVGGFKVVEYRQESMIIKATLNSKIKEQERMENSINFINMKCHDLRKELRKIKAKKDNLSDEDFALLEESLNFYDSSIKTGDVNIDALIQEKLIYCNSLGIELTALVDGKAFEDICSSDVYFLLTNILDNAIEAVEKIENKEKRVISIIAKKKQGILSIEQYNYYEGTLDINPDGSIKTSKNDSKFHGIGTKSIVYIVKKYDGSMGIETKDNIFKLTIAI